MTNSMGSVASKQSISHAFYTYAHYNKVNNKIFYIGKGKKNRYKTTHKRNLHWNGIVNKYGFEPKILAYWATEKEAFEHEKLLIACFKDMGYVLANKTDGGEGTASEKLRQAALNRPKRTLTENHKQKIGLAHLGKKRSLEAKQNMSKAAHNKKIINRPPCKEETKEKIRQKLLGRVMSEESRLKMIATKLAKRGAL
jgi:hypothetical protein